jgi:G:T-mismatch repair DNA endonuclease (very short patch repair protein)
LPARQKGDAIPNHQEGDFIPSNDVIGPTMRSSSTTAIARENSQPEINARTRRILAFNQFGRQFHLIHERAYAGCSDLIVACCTPGEAVGS